MGIYASDGTGAAESNVYGIYHSDGGVSNSSRVKAMYHGDGKGNIERVFQYISHENYRLKIPNVSDVSSTSVDHLGNLFIAVDSDTTTDASAPVLAKVMKVDYNNNVSEFIAPESLGGGNGTCTIISTDQNNNLYIGYSENGVYTLFKFSNVGLVEWSAKVPSVITDVITNDKFVWVSYSIAFTGGIIKYDLAGNVIWNKALTDSENTKETYAVYRLAISKEGKLFAAARVNINSVSILFIENDGNIISKISRSTISLVASFPPEIKYLHLDENENVYFIYPFSNMLSGLVYNLAVYSPDGSALYDKKLSSKNGSQFTASKSDVNIHNTGYITYTAPYGILNGDGSTALAPSAVDFIGETLGTGQIASMESMSVDDVGNIYTVCNIKNSDGTYGATQYVSKFTIENYPKISAS